MWNTFFLRICNISEFKLLEIRLESDNDLRGRKVDRNEAMPTGEKFPSKSSIMENIDVTFRNES